VERLRAAIDRFNGGLLCDDVGMGKTYVAIAIASQFDRWLVVCPAALSSMWQTALSATGATAGLTTFETLSRTRLEDLRETYDLVVVDEAHHVRNPRTNRYFALESIVRGAKVLLLTATPIHNRRDDLVALLALFLGSRACTMTSAELALCVVRREHEHLPESLPIPAIAPTIYHDLPDDCVLVERLMNLPPPIPVRDGGLGGVLIGRSLVHQWASSEAALIEAVRRRIARAGALCTSLEAGTYPTALELETWIYGDGVLQLGFPELLSAPSVENPDLLRTVRVHLEALQQIRAHFASLTRIDAGRAEVLASISASRRDCKVVAFAQYAETVSMFFRRLAPRGGVAMLTSHGARVVGGALTRKDAIGRFAPHASGSPEPAPAEAIDLLLTTDLLSEGVNLQDGEVVVHLDIPWTAARMEQRVGRVARLGSRHTAVSVHVIRPPRSASEVLGSESIVRHKWHVARNVVGTSASNPAPESDVAAVSSQTDHSAAEGAPAQSERLRSMLQGWITNAADEPQSQRAAPIVATVASDRPGFLAAVSADDVPQLVVGFDEKVSTDLEAQIAACLNIRFHEIPTGIGEVVRAAETIRNWFVGETASAVAGLAESSSLRRRAITTRIDLAIEDAPPHLRVTRLITAARARKVATKQQCAAVERELDALLHSDLAADQWLSAMASLQPNEIAPRGPTRSSECFKIHAILLMR